MPRFFFDFRDGGCSRGFDNEGLELVDAERAKREAMVAVTQVMQLETLDNDRRVVECRVRNSSGAEVYSVSLGYKGMWAGSREKSVQFRSVHQLRR